MLTQKQQRFVEEYVSDCDAQNAAIRAGFSPQSARQAGKRLLRQPEIQAALLRRQAEIRERTAISKERVLRELAGMAFANGADFVQVVDGKTVPIDPAALPEEKRAAILNVREGKSSPEIVTYDKLKALELLGKHLGLFDGSCREGGQERSNLLDAIRQATCRDLEGSEASAL